MQIDVFLGTLLGCLRSTIYPMQWLRFLTADNPAMADITYRQLSIASFNFRIHDRNTSLPSHHNDPVYNQFHSPVENPHGHTVTIRLLDKNDMPCFTSFEKQFETSQSWSMYGNSDAKYIVFRSPGSSNEPEWVAKIYADLKHVDVFCKSSTNPLRYPLDQILLINLLVGRGLIIHAAGVVIDGKGYLFAGPSGAGKSTICGLFKEGGSITMLSDDRIVIEKKDDDFLMFGTPWPGDAGIAVNESAGLHGIFFLNHSLKNIIKEISHRDALANLCKVASLPWYDSAELQRSLDFCEDLLKKVKAYDLHFRPGSEIIAEILSSISD